MKKQIQILLQILLQILILIKFTSSKRLRNTELKISSLGDWGDEPLWTYNISEYVKEGNPDVVLLIGDNFYVSGVNSSTDEQWNTKFKIPFSNATFPFYAVLGNHDYYGNWSAQIGRDSKSIPPSFIMPNNYYTRVIEKDGVSVYLIAIDTWLLNGGDTVLNAGSPPTIKSNKILEDSYKNKIIDEETFNFIRKNFKEKTIKDQNEIDEKGYKWIKFKLDEGQSYDWIVIIGHFPIFSCSRHGETNTLVKYLNPMLTKNIIYINGHDHLLQIIERDSIYYFGSGAGAKKESYCNQNYKGLVKNIGDVYGYMEHKFSKYSVSTDIIANINGTKTIVATHLLRFSNEIGISFYRVIMSDLTVFEHLGIPTDWSTPL